MSKSSVENIHYWRSASNYILSFPKIRFVVVISKMGRLIVGNYKKGIAPIAEMDHYKLCMEHALDLFMKKDLDDILGPLDYTVSKRKNMVIITVPVNDHPVLISAEPDTTIEPIIQDILQKLTFQK